MIVDGGYFPSCVVNFTLRFDEALQVAETPDELRRAIRTGEIGRLTVDERAAGSQEIYTGQRRRALPNRGQTPRWVVRPPTGGALGLGSQGPGGTPTAQFTTDPKVTDSWVRAGAQDALRPLTFGSDGFTVVLDQVPKRASFDMPHPRLAATFNMSFDFADLPIDPRLLRAAGVEIHIGCVSAKDFGDGMVGVDGDGRRRSRLATRSRLIDPTTGRPAVRDSTLLYFGTVDNWDFELDRNGGTNAILTGRSIVGILLDGKPPADVLLKIDLTRPIHRVIADLIATIPIDQRLTLDVYTDASEWNGGVVPSPGSIEGFTKVRIGASSGQPKSSGGGAKDVSYWDLITNLCNSVGGIPHLQGNILWIRPGRSVFDVYDRARPPFAGDREAPDGKLAIRRLVVGHNLTRFKLGRQFGGTPVPVVRAYGRDDRKAGAARLIYGQWPPAGSPAAAAKGDEELTRIDFPQIRDKDQLTQIARDVYEEVGRGEVGGEFESAQLSSFGGSNADPDMLRLRPLEPFEVVTDVRQRGGTALTSELSRRAAMSFEDEVEDLTSRIGDKDAARVIVAASRGAVVGVFDTFRVTSLRFEVDASTGIKVSGTYQNYIVARHGHSEEIAKENSRVIGARADVPGAGKKRKAKKKPAKRVRGLDSWMVKIRDQAINDPQFFREVVRNRQRQEQAIRAQQRLNPPPNSYGGNNGRMRI